MLGENVWARGNELDLIVRRGRRLVFCEVKAKLGEQLRRSGRDGGLREAAAAAASGRGVARGQPELSQLEIQFDVVAVGGGRLTHIGDAF